MLNTQEHIDLMKQFEQSAGKMLNIVVRTEREHKSLWKAGRIYCHGETNSAFLAYRLGYALGKSIHQQAAA